MVNYWYEKYIVKYGQMWTHVLSFEGSFRHYFRRFLTTKNIAKSRGKKQKNWDPLKITKQTHFLITQNINSAYREYFVFQCG